MVEKALVALGSSFALHTAHLCFLLNLIAFFFSVYANLVVQFLIILIESLNFNLIFYLHHLDPFSTKTLTVYSIVLRLKH